MQTFSSFQEKLSQWASGKQWSCGFHSQHCALHTVALHAVLNTGDYFRDIVKLSEGRKRICPNWSNIPVCSSCTQQAGLHMGDLLHYAIKTQIQGKHIVVLFEQLHSWSFIRNITSQILTKENNFKITQYISKVSNK